MPCDEVVHHERIRLRMIETLEIPKLFNVLFFTRAVYKTLVQYWILLTILLFKIPRPTYILCQNPPAIPLMAVAMVVSLFRRSKVVIDWHNYGYTWLKVNRPGSNLLVNLYHIYERFFGKLAHHHLCVSNAMQADLANNWGIQASVVHDRPQPFFKRLSPTERHQLFKRYDWAKDAKDETNNQTAFTDSNGKLKEDRPALMVSSTSWTADEDFGVLLDAVVECDNRAKIAGKPFPLVRFVVTGKGDLQEFYKAKIAKLKLSYFTFYTEFLPFADYAALLGSADLGVSLHFSSSKLDLPMKVVDMFGAELPVAAYDYGCLSELVQNDVNGFTFQDARQLSHILYKTLVTFPGDMKTLDSMRSNIKEFKKVTWKETWSEAALPIFGISAAVSSSPKNRDNKSSASSKPSQDNTLSSPGSKSRKRNGRA
jgi:beta-1,4-mannosyltransferase